jgi:TetR/AcrR family transcriptional regulator of autoinduction and epiphytic fitness
VETTDRRAALKARHHRAILDAARALITEGSSARFSVDQLAERADVSRRTIFNHFASIDDVVTSVCSEGLGTVIEQFRAVVVVDPAGPGTRGAAFATLTEALRATDVPGLIVFLWRALGGFDKGDPRPRQIFQATFARTSHELARELSARYAELDPLEAELLVSSLMHGTEVIAEHWLSVTGAATGESERQLWRELLERMIHRVKTGY